MTTDQRDRPLSKRERIAIRLLLFIIALLAPWQYDHQFKSVLEDLKKELRELYVKISGNNPWSRD